MINFWLLSFLPLAALPIILHLITLHRLRTIDLSTFRFLMDGYLQQRRRLKLLEWLIMLLRTAFVALVVVTLARPVVQGLGFLAGGRGGRDVAVVIDDGAPMGLRTAGTTSLERAGQTAETILSRLGPDDHVTLLSAGAAPKILADRYADQTKPMVEMARTLKPDSVAGDIPAALAVLLDAGRRRPTVIYVLSDCSRHAWAGLAGHPAQKLLTPGTKLVVLDVGPTEPVVNAAVIGDEPRGVRPVVGLPVLLSATVVNTSALKSIDTVLSLSLDGVQMARADLSLRPGQQATRSFTVTPARGGLVRGKFAIEPDAYPEDDTFFFCLNVEPHLRVLLVSPEAAAPGKTNPALYVRAALEAPLHLHGDEGGALAADRALADALVVATVGPEQATAARLDWADVVMLADLPMTADLAKLLRNYLEDGGGMLILPGARVRPELYNAMLLQPADAPGAGAGVSLDQPTGDPNDESAFLPAMGPDLTHPVLSPLAEPGTNYLATLRFYRYFPLHVAAAPAAPPGTDARVLLRLPDKRPILVECRIGRGAVLLAGVPPTPDWSNLPLQPEFVPILLRAVAYLRRAPGVELPACVPANQPAAISLTDRWPEAQVQATDPAGKPATVTLHRDGGRMVGALMQTAAKGYYNITILPREGDAPSRVSLGTAVNVVSDRNDFVKLDGSALASLTRPAEFTYLRSTPADPVLEAELSERREIWRTLIWVMFAVIGVEFLLSTLRPPGERKARQEAPGIARRAQPAQAGTRSASFPKARKVEEATR